MKKTGRVLLVILVLVVCTALIYPTIRWYFFIDEDTKTLALSSNSAIRDYSTREARRIAAELTSLALSDQSAEIPKGYDYLGKGSCYSVLSGYKDEIEFQNAIENHIRGEIFDVKNLSGRALKLGLDLRGGMSVILEADRSGYEELHGEAISDPDVSALVAEDMDILSSRVDQFGVSEPEIRMQGSDQIVLELPGEADPERVDSLLRGRGSLSFHLADNALSERVSQYYRMHPDEIYDEDGRVRTPSFVPFGYTALGYYEEDEYGLDRLMGFVVISDEVVIDGTHLETARSETSSRDGRPVVTFRFDDEGGEIFYSFTSRHIGSSLSLVLDDMVKSVATINSAIGNSVELSGGFTREEAESIAVILKSASLPMPLSVVSEQTVGASLGDDAVQIALYAIFIGLFLVLIFMMVYYGPAGFIADIALLLNFYMMLSVLSALSFTLTLTSIAGIVLTLGMAIDANVIIYERMKEEKREGKTPFEVVKAGFSGAFWTIMDSNVTTIIAAVVLSVFGSSSVKGFANTLAIGVTCSLFTALFVSHLLFDFFVSEHSLSGVALSWRRSK